MTALIDTVRILMDANLRRDKQTFLSYLDPAIEYHYHVGSRPLIGTAWVERFLDKYWGTMTDVIWRVDRYAENGNKLLVEGYEEYVIKDTGQKVAHPYMGIYEFKDGKITHWRDYFEM